MQRELSEIDMEIDFLLTSSPSCILNEEGMNLLLVLKGCKEKFIAHELLSWQLKSRTKWAELGDANTKYFHSIALAHRNHNSIRDMQDEDDS